MLPVQITLDAEAAERLTGLARPVVEGGMQIINDAFGPVAKEGGQLVGDLIAIAGGPVRVWKLSNCLRIADNARRVLSQHGISHRQLPKDFLIPWIEATTNVENELLSAMWAELLASEVLESSDRHKRFIPILKAMTPEEARLLHHAASFPNAIQLPSMIRALDAQVADFAISLRLTGPVALMHTDLQ